MKKITINENDLKTLVYESVSNILKFFSDSGLFDNYPLLAKLEKILYIFNKSSFKVDDDYSITNWYEIIESIECLYEKAKERDLFNKLNIGEFFIKNSGDWDVLNEYLKENGYDYNNWEYISDYLEEPKTWDSQLPKIEELNKMVEELKHWAKLHFEMEEEAKIREIRWQKKWVISNLEKI